jgi:regulator of replication initiation timing
MNKQDKNKIIDGKIKNIESELDYIYNQITELRTTIQEIYGEIISNNKNFYSEMIKISERLEDMSKYIANFATENSGKKEIHFDVSPITTINPIITNTNTNTQNENKKEKEEDSDYKRYFSKKYIYIAITALLGFFISVGTISLIAYKIYSFLI